MKADYYIIPAVIVLLIILLLDAFNAPQPIQKLTLSDSTNLSCLFKKYKLSSGNAIYDFPTAPYVIYKGKKVMLNTDVCYKGDK